jgi:flavorubredoxin
MDTAFQALKISDSVYWVGAIDWSLRNFHGYETSRGSTYNAYLVMGEKITLIDTVKPNFYDEMMSRIRSVIDPTEIDTVIINHAEMDHSGALPMVVRDVNPSKVIASKKGKQALDAHFDMGDSVEEVKTGDVLDIGGKTLKFIETRMLHWPDSMFTFLGEEGVLFSNDAFGMHLATSQRFADELHEDLLNEEAAKYYANILLHLSKVVQRLLKQLPSFNLDIKIIASDHGPIYRENVEWIINKYAEWSEQKPTKKAVVVYDTMWVSTQKMAAAVADGLFSQNLHVELMPLAGAHRSNVATEVLDAGALVVGSPTINNQIYPTVADIMNYLKGLKPQNLVGATFGSYGWSGEAVKHMDAMMTEMGVELVREGYRVNYVPKEDHLKECFKLGADVGKALNAKFTE